MNPIEFGMQFLEKEPNALECANVGIDGILKTGSQWRSCTKDEICSSSDSSLKYRGI